MVPSHLTGPFLRKSEELRPSPTRAERPRPDQQGPLATSSTTGSCSTRNRFARFDVDRYDARLRRGSPTESRGFLGRESHRGRLVDRRAVLVHDRRRPGDRLANRQRQEPREEEGQGGRVRLS